MPEIPDTNNWKRFTDLMSNPGCVILGCGGMIALVGLLVMLLAIASDV